MATTVNLYEAKTQLSKLVERAAAGEEIVIAKAGKPMARLVPVEASRPKKLREPGLLKGKVWIAEDFDEWPEDILAAFEADIKPAEQASPHDQADERR
jgi:prevent-host-death family protein